MGIHRKAQLDSTTEQSGTTANLATVISNALGDSDKYAAEPLNLELYPATAPNVPTCCSYEPSLLVVAQGKKRVDLGKANYSFGETTFLLTSLELPVVSQVLVVSKEAPYLAFFFKLDIPTVREILNSEEVDVPESAARTSGMTIGVSTSGLIDSCSRLVNLLSAPKDMPFIGKLLRREITYRLLQSSQGARLRAIATPGNQDHRSAKVVAWLRKNYSKPLDIHALADLAGMRRSTLHHHFRALTAMSPLQFQKQLRLQAARQRMLTDKVDATSAAFEDRYESEPVQSRIPTLLWKSSSA